VLPRGTPWRPRCAVIEFAVDVRFSPRPSARLRFLFANNPRGLVCDRLTIVPDDCV